MRKLWFGSAVGIVLGLASASEATVIGFAQLGGNNTTVPAALGSAAIADSNGVTVSNGTTPNISLTWDANWDIHTSSQFRLLDQQTVGGVWDNDGNTANARVGQLDFSSHSVGISAGAGFAVVLNSFDFAMTSETPGTSEWLLTLTNANAAVVWSQAVSFNTVGMATNTGDVKTITPNFTGGGSYTLTFQRTANSYNTDGRMGIDNFSFSQVVPEPTSLGLIGMLAPSLIRRRRA